MEDCPRLDNRYQQSLYLFFVRFTDSRGERGNLQYHVSPSREKNWNVWRVQESVWQFPGTGHRNSKEEKPGKEEKQRRSILYTWGL